MKFTIKFVSCLLICVFASCTVFAEEQQTPNTESTEIKIGGKGDFHLDGYYRLRATNIGEIDGIKGSEPIPRAYWYWDQRLQMTPYFDFNADLGILKRISIYSAMDIYDGQFRIDETRMPCFRADERTWDQQFLRKNSDWTEDGFNLRHYWMEIDLTAVVVRVGRMGSNWGTGILASDGLGYNDDFGDNYFGDTVEGAVIATKPIDLVSGGKIKTDFILAFSYDWKVIQDRTGDEGDEPSQYIIAIMKQPDKPAGSTWKDMKGGVYYVHREQDKNTIVNVLDGTISIPLLFSDGKPRLVNTAEAVYIWGETDANVSIRVPDGSDIEMKGLMNNLAFLTKKFDVIAEVGYASGDPNPYDDKITNMSFNPDYNVGLILFDRVISAATAYSSAKFTSPSLSKVPPAGIDLLPTNGSVTNATYFYPRIKVRPIDNLQFIAGLLYAKAQDDLIDPYQSFLHGGAPTNYNGGTANDDLGWELDLGADYTFGNPKKFALKAGGQWGWFWPGDAFDDSRGNAMKEIDFAQFRLDMIF